MTDTNKVTYLEFPEGLNDVKMIKLDDGNTYINKNFKDGETELVYLTESDIKRAKEAGKQYIWCCGEWGAMY